MRYKKYVSEDAAQIVALITATFSASEGEREGRAVGGLAREMLHGVRRKDLRGFVAQDGERIAGAALFTRLIFDSGVDAFILSPLAVHPEYQGAGIGQKLIQFGLRSLRKNGVQWVLTYGDPAYYGKTGFCQIDEKRVRAPQPLSHPYGWLAQPLAEQKLSDIFGSCRCVAALDKPEYW